MRAAGIEICLPRFLQQLQQREGQAGGKSASALCVSLGPAGNFADGVRLLDLVGGLRNQTALSIGAVSFDIESCRVVRDGG